MNTIEVFTLDSLLKTMTMAGLEKALDKLKENSGRKAIEIADLVEKNEDIRLKNLLTERALLKDYISRIEIQINLLIVKHQSIKAITVV